MEIIKAPAKQHKTAPAQVRDGEDIEGVLDRHAEFSDDPISACGSLHCRDGAIRFLKLTSVTAIRPDKRQIALQPPR
jgi:hypothetical protein